DPGSPELLGRPESPFPTDQPTRGIHDDRVEQVVFRDTPRQRRDVTHVLSPPLWDRDLVDVVDPDRRVICEKPIRIGSHFSLLRHSASFLSVVTVAPNRPSTSGTATGAGSGRYSR